MAHNAGEGLKAYKDQQGPEQHSGCLTDPGLVNRLFLKKPERLEAFGLVFFWALLLWRVMERARRRQVDTTRRPLPGWDTQATARPTSCMMVTQCAGVMVFKLGHDRQLARPLAVVHQHSLTALDVPATWCTLPPGSQRTTMAAPRLSRQHTRLLQW